MSIYFDHNATTPVHSEVFRSMEPYYKHQFGNASCLYRLGVDAGYAVEKSRIQVARLIGGVEERVVFTSGGTESDNAALKGVVYASGKKHIITSLVEHPAVIETCHFLERYVGCKVDYLPVDREGRVNPRDVERRIGSDTALISIMTANNEIGSIQPIQEICKIARAYGVPFHTDAVQAVGKIPVNVEELGVDLLSLSAHKMYGPKGVGALYVGEGVSFVAHALGGAQEKGLRGGTENVPGIVGLGKAAELAKKELKHRMSHEERLRERLWEALCEMPMEVLRNSPARGCLPGTLNFSLGRVNARELIRAMSEEGFCLSTGSACSQGKTTPSHVIKALGRTDEEATAAVRISLGYENSEDEIDRFVQVFPSVVERVRSECSLT